MSPILGYAASRPYHRTDFQGYANRNLLRFEQISVIKFNFQHYEDFTSLWLCMSKNRKNAKIWTKTNLMQDN